MKTIADQLQLIDAALEDVIQDDERDDIFSKDVIPICCLQTDCISIPGSFLLSSTTAWQVLPNLQ
jgi:hypothetical protein